MHRARRIAPLRVAFAAALLVLVPAPSALATNVWPSGTKALVQQAEGTQINDPMPSGTLDVQAHGYGYTPSGPQLQVRIQEGAIVLPGHALTLLDFDRDGKPDVLVDAEMRIENQS
ncbi:MAG: hypothetical protein AAGC46_13805, partial [Solirubrobacteraceae bacterium]|nr:hypothetical protein [Patulibacter sp.]